MQQFLEGRLSLKMIEAAIFLVIVLFFYALLRRAGARIKKKFAGKEAEWRLHWQSVISLPVHVLMGIVLSTTVSVWILEELGQSEDLRLFFSAIREAGIVICLTWCLFRWKKVWYDSCLSRKAQGKILLDPASLGFLNKLAPLFTMMMAVLFLLHIAGLNIWPLVTFGGIGAASMAFASKDIFSNFFSGLMLHVPRPFTVHDQVELPGKKVVGRIEEIGWCLTVIRDLQKRAVYLPNSFFSNEVLINISRMTHRRIEETVRFRCMDVASVSGCIRLIRECLDVHPYIDHQLPVYVFLNALGTSFAEIEIKAYTTCVDYEKFSQVKEEVLLKAHEIVALQTSS